MLEPFVMGGAVRAWGHPGVPLPELHECPRRTHPTLVEAKDSWEEDAWVALSHSARSFISAPSQPGYGFLPPAQAEMLARQQELLRKQNLAR